MRTKFILALTILILGVIVCFFGLSLEIFPLIGLGIAIMFIDILYYEISEDTYNDINKELTRKIAEIESLKRRIASTHSIKLH